MPSNSLEGWRGPRAAALDEIAAAHTAVGGLGRGRRYATEQINHAYAVLLAGQFQGFCRDLHTECAYFLVNNVGLPPAVSEMFRTELTRGRMLDRGNAHPGSLGSDFARFDFPFWDSLRGLNPAAVQWSEGLDLLNAWRNAVAHQDFTSPRLEGGTLGLVQVRRWRRMCDRLAGVMDLALGRQLLPLTGSEPWA